MLNLKEMETEELNDLFNKIKEELSNRNKEKIVYKTEFRRSNSGYNRWAKRLLDIDSNKNNGYAFIGDWLKNGDEEENIVNKNDYVIEFIDYKENQYFLYKASDNNKKELLLNGDKKQLASFIENAKKIIEGE